MNATRATLASTVVLLVLGAHPSSAQLRPAADETRSSAAPVRTLAEAVARAVAVHPSLAAARAAADAAAARVESRRAPRLPQLGVQGSAIRFQEPMLVAPLHRFDPTAIPDFDETLMQGVVGIDWALFDGGRRSGEVRGARAHQGASEQGTRAAEAALIQRTADTFLSVLTARELMRSQTRHEAALEAELERARRMVDEGAAPELELLRAQAELASARAERESIRQRMNLAVTTLAHLLDLPPGELEAQSFLEPALPVAASHEPGDRSSRLVESPAVAAARAMLSAAEAQQDVARSAWFPTLSAVGGYNVFAGGGVSPVAEWQGGLRVSYPLFTGGSRSGGVDASRAAVREARARVEQAEEQAALAADAARAHEAEARARAEALESAVARFAELARVERLALDEGVGMQSDWLRAEAGLLQARAGLAEARHRVVSARIAWARATGRLEMGLLNELLEGTS